ncbi:MAG TPA: hypothetical protein VG672_14785 [Bryobacteraceae bacterium]|jgi:hypothetical protein|nr:hypothetical protein [Bryobacteraceae bacterium]
MKMKLLVAFAVAGLSLASAKSYELSLTQPTTIGTTQLQPGTYKMELGASKVTLTGKKGQTVEANAKFETVEKKFDRTAIVSKTVDGTARIDEIHLGGTKTKVEFTD